MSLIKIKSKLTYAGYFALIVIIYSTFVALDMITGFALNQINGNRAISIENARKCEEDYQMVENARFRGLSSLIYPDLYDISPFKEIALKYNVAPLGAQPNTDVYYCNEGYGQVEYKTDRFGFRNSDSIWKSKPDAILIGDSFVHGACVSSDNTISGVLNNAGMRSINLGTGSNGPIHYGAIAKNFIRVTKPKFAIMVFYPNDNVDGDESSIFNKLYFEENRNYFDKITGSDFELSTQLAGVYRESKMVLSELSRGIEDKRARAKIECSKTNSFVGKVRSFKKYFTYHLKLSSIVELFRVFYNQPYGSISTSLPYSTMLAINTLKEECTKNDCTPIVLYIPNSKFWRPDSRANSYESLLKGYCTTKEIRFISVSDEMNALGLNAYAIKGPHLSPIGYAKIAQKIINHTK